MERIERSDKSNAGPSDGTTRDGAGTMSGALRDGLRVRGFAEGEAHVMPNEGKGRKKGQVDLGTPELTSLRDIPRGDTARIDAMVEREIAAGGGLVADRDAWVEALGEQSARLSAARNMAEDLFLERSERAPPTTAAFRAIDVERREAYLEEARRCGNAAALTSGLRVSAGAGFSVLALADDRFRGFGGAAEAAGLARRDDGGIRTVDADAVAAESGAFEGGLDPVFRATMHEEVDLGGIAREAQRVSFIANDLALLGATVRADALKERAAADAAEQARIEDRIRLVDDLATVVDLAIGLVPGLEGLEDAAAPTDLARDAAPGMLTNIVNHDAAQQVARLQRRIVATAALVDKTHQDIDAVRLRRRLDEFEAALDGLCQGLEKASAALESQRQKKIAVGLVQDQQARDGGDLSAEHERFVPVADRSARASNAASANDAARQTVRALGNEARTADEPFAELLAPTDDIALYDTRRTVGASVPGRLRRRITRLSAELDHRAQVLATARATPSQQLGER